MRELTTTELQSINGGIVGGAAAGVVIICLIALLVRSCQKK